MRILALLFITVSVIIFINHFPDLLPVLVVPKGFIYLGHNSYFDPWDINLYASVIHYGQWGGILLSNQYTSIQNNPILLYPFLTSIGFLFKHVNPFLLFHITSIVGDLILLGGLFYFLRKLHISSRLAIFAIFVTSLGGGFGFLGWGKWFLSDINDSQLTFYTTLQKGHEAIATISFIGALILFYRSIVQNQKTQHILFLAFLLTVSVFIYPYTLVSFFLISGFFLFFYREGGRLEDKDYKHMGIMLIPSVIIVLFLSYQLSSNPTFSDIGTHIPTALFPLLGGYGILIPLFIFQCFFLSKNPLRIFLSIWFLVVFTLGVLPIGPGQVFLRGSFFPITLVCILFLQEITKKWGNITYFLFVLFAFFLIGSSVYVFTSRIQSAYAKSYWVYIPKNDYTVFEYLQHSTPENSAVFSLFTLGNQIPAFTRNRVYFGHTLQTPNVADKQSIAISFFLGEGSVNQEKDILKENNISYILLGENERALYKKFAKKKNSLFTTLSSFHKVFQSTNLSLYKVE